MLVVVGSFRLPMKSVPVAREAMARVVAATRDEPGCLAYAYAEDLFDPGLFRVNEAWSDRATLAAHFATPHMDRWRAERAALGMTEREVIAYEVASEEAL